MGNKKKVKVDYAVIIRGFEMYGRGHSFKRFCDATSYFFLIYFNALGSVFCVAQRVYRNIDGYINV